MVLRLKILHMAVMIHPIVAKYVVYSRHGTSIYSLLRRFEHSMPRAYANSESISARQRFLDPSANETHVVVYEAKFMLWRHPWMIGSFRYNARFVSVLTLKSADEKLSYHIDAMMIVVQPEISV
jgi:hypothetical protein